MTLMLVYRATQDTPCETFSILTPLTEMLSVRLARPPLLVPVLRTGLGMVDEGHVALPEVQVGFVGCQ